MSEEPQEIASLRQALSLSPDNHLLRRMLADTLLKYGQLQAAVDEYRSCLRENPEDHDLMTALAQAYAKLERPGEALVILEQLLTLESPPKEAIQLHASLTGQSPNRPDPEASEAETDDETEELLRAVEEAFGEPDEADEEREAMPAGDQPLDPHLEVERPKINFDSVGGMEEVKKQVRLKIILPLENPDLYKAYGKVAGGGILMYGPPGCGKTLLARATAGQVHSRFMAIGIHEVLEMWIGQSERNLHALFEQARNSKPCVLFFDEVDALAASRSDMRQNAGRQLINQFLDELDGVRTSNDGVLILAATNAPWHLDPAFRRPGRFDRILFVPPPDEPARAAILNIMLRDKPTGDLDYKTLAKKTDGYSGADLKALIDQTIERQIEKAAESGQIEPIRTRDLQEVMKRIKPSTREWFATAKNYALFSNQGGHYDDILDYLKLR